MDSIPFETRKAQSDEDKRVVTIKPIANGFTVRIDGLVYAYTTLDEALDFIKLRLTFPSSS